MKDLPELLTENQLLKFFAFIFRIVYMCIYDIYHRETKPSSTHVEVVYSCDTRGGSDFNHGFSSFILSPAIITALSWIIINDYISPCVSEKWLVDPVIIILRYTFLVSSNLSNCT